MVPGFREVVGDLVLHGKPVFFSLPGGVPKQRFLHLLHLGFLFRPKGETDRSLAGRDAKVSAADIDPRDRTKRHAAVRLLYEFLGIQRKARYSGSRIPAFLRGTGVGLFAMEADGQPLRGRVG